MAAQKTTRYTLGLDIGIASIGWCLMGKEHIIDLGVRAFEKAETSDKGKPLNLKRRQARLARRRLAHRAIRLKKVVKALKQEGAIVATQMLQHPPQKGTPMVNPWLLRVKALDEKLTPTDWARVVYHLCKHRGFYWQSRAEEVSADNDDEGGKIKQALHKTQKLMQEKHYRTAAQMVLGEFSEPRNKQHEYTKSLSRVLLEKECRILFQRQRELGNRYASEQLELRILGDGSRKNGLFWQQKAPLSGQDLLDRLGKCALEHSEYRAPKASYSAERHVWLTRLNNLRIHIQGQVRALTEQERQLVLPLPYQQKGHFTYKQLRKKMEKAGLWPENEVTFAGLRYPSGYDTKTKDPEGEYVVKLEGWHTLRSSLESRGLLTEWQNVATDTERMDQIATVLSIYKTDEEVSTELAKLALTDEVQHALLGIRFSKFINLSLKVLHKIIPYMEQGMRYDEACVEAGYHHSQNREKTEKTTYLPPLYCKRNNKGTMVLYDREGEYIPRNPVVLRALNQARKVINAIVRQYGSPWRVHVELARDLSNPYEERRRIEKEQQLYRESNERAKAQAANDLGIDAHLLRGKDFEKYRLYNEQSGKCVYTLQPIDLNRLCEEGYVEVDHALPFSRTFDNSKNNRVLTFKSENQNKGNKTPYEYLSGAENSEQWQAFTAYVTSNKAYRQAKKNRLLKTNLNDSEEESFHERNLNDTRYICRFLKNYIEDHLKLADDSPYHKTVTVNGQMTSLMRARWGLIKVRADSDRHHALDAAVVAACSEQMINRINRYAKCKELEHVKTTYINPQTGEVLAPDKEGKQEQFEHHFPRPWPHFRNELLCRLQCDNQKQMHAQLQALGYTEEMLVTARPLRVSRAPSKRNKGAAHKETIYRCPAYMCQLNQLTTTNLKSLHNDYSENFYKALEQWLERTRNIKAQIARITRHTTSLSGEEESHINEYRAQLAHCFTDPDTGKEVHAVKLYGAPHAPMDAQQATQRIEIEKLSEKTLPYILGYQDKRNQGLIRSLRQWLLSKESNDVRIKGMRANAKQQKRELTPEEQATITQLQALPRKPCKADPENGPYTGPVIRRVQVDIGKTTGRSVRGGLAANDTMLRVDVFTKGEGDKRRFYLVPVYVADAVSRALPNQDKNGVHMDANFAFHMSLHRNDWIKVSFKKDQPVQGYYAGYDSSTAAISMYTHDRKKKLDENQQPVKGGIDTVSGREVTKDGLIRGIGVKTAANIEKSHVGVLGRLYPSTKPEQREVLHAGQIDPHAQARLDLPA